MQCYLLLIKNKILRCRSNQNIQNLYGENYKTVKKEIKEYVNKSLTWFSHWATTNKQTYYLHELQNSIYYICQFPKVISRCNTILIKIPERFL